MTLKKQIPSTFPLRLYVSPLAQVLGIPQIFTKSAQLIIESSCEFSTCHTLKFSFLFEVFADILTITILNNSHPSFYILYNAMHRHHSLVEA